jgi:hypothetical protein
VKTESFRDLKFKSNYESVRKWIFNRFAYAHLQEEVQNRNISSCPSVIIDVEMNALMNCNINGANEELVSKDIYIFT